MPTSGVLRRHASYQPGPKVLLKKSAAETEFELQRLTSRVVRRSVRFREVQSDAATTILERRVDLCATAALCLIFTPLRSLSRRSQWSHSVRCRGTAITWSMGWRSRHPATSPSPARTFSATVILDSRRRPAAFDRITEVSYVAQSRRLAAAPSAYARGRPVRRSLHSYPREAPNLRNRAALFEAQWCRRLSRRRPSGLGGSRRQGVYLRPGVGTVLPAKRHSPDIPARPCQARR
jgi:hypothetical protein